ncbi:hypothetical protein K2173_009593 [Erythroxylum novogranatense]|uniref:Uncharacterized protein n=1 Tax=Erythroxylum novogranatense TaxID=1862640 RepID=A0AAV8U4C9_9ROSI|nr:hypothetical protein K2173_009593 [Erythroxylum novogranatense]
MMHHCGHIFRITGFTTCTDKQSTDSVFGEIWTRITDTDVEAPLWGGKTDTEHGENWAWTITKAMSYLKLKHVGNHHVLLTTKNMLDAASRRLCCLFFLTFHNSIYVVSGLKSLQLLDLDRQTQLETFFDGQPKKQSLL